MGHTINQFIISILPFHIRFSFLFSNHNHMQLICSHIGYNYLFIPLVFNCVFQYNHQIEHQFSMSIIEALANLNLAKCKSIDCLTALKDITHRTVNQPTNQSNTVNIDNVHNHLLIQYVNYHPLLTNNNTLNIKQFLLNAIKEEVAVTEQQLQDTEERNILIDWLGRVHAHMNLHDETLHLTISLVDRYFAVANLSKNYYRLVGITCLRLAAKVVETRIKSIRRWLKYVTDLTVENILAMEQDILTALQFRLDVPTQYSYYGIIRLYFKTSINVDLFTNYLLEICNLSTRFLKYRPSLKALCALYLSLRILYPKDNQASEMETVAKLIDVSRQQVRECCRSLIEGIYEQKSGTALYGKYQKRNEISKVRFTNLKNYTRA